MEKISKAEYLKYSIEQDFPLKLQWVISMFSVIMDDTDYVKFGLKDSLFVTVNDVDYILEDCIKDKPVFDPTDKITVKEGFLLNIHEDIDTTVGRILLNYILLTYNFKGKVEYQNKVFTIGQIEDNYVAALLKDDVENDDKYISVDEYNSFVDSAMYLENWADVISVSSTEKSIVPPPGIKEYRAKLLKEAIEKHGPDALKDYAIVAAIETDLKAYDKEYLKDDPSLGKLLDGKILNNSRKKLFLMNGADKGFKGDGEAILLDKSLDEGWEKDPVKLAEQFNTIRYGSYTRGKETFKGGLTAKILLRATSSMLVEMKDCKTKAYKSWLVTKDNVVALIGRYIMISDKPILLETKEQVGTYIDKVVKLRSPMYCLAKGENICSVCSGTGLADNENSIPLLITTIGENVLKMSLAATHRSGVSTVRLNWAESVK